jgi:hypothetical protein
MTNEALETTIDIKLRIVTGNGKVLSEETIERIEIGEHDETILKECSKIFRTGK